MDKKVVMATSHITLLSKNLQTLDAKIYYRYTTQLDNGVIDFKKVYKSVDMSFAFSYASLNEYRRLKGLAGLVSNYNGTNTYAQYFLDCVNYTFKGEIV